MGHTLPAHALASLGVMEIVQDESPVKDLKKVRVVIKLPHIIKHFSYTLLVIARQVGALYYLG